MRSEYERLKKRLTNKVLLDKIAQGDNYFKEKKYLEAIAEYNSVLMKLEKSYEFDTCEMYRKIGNCYYYMGSHDNARDYYEKTLNYCTTNESIYSMLAWLWYNIDVDTSLKYYNKTLSFNATNGTAFTGKALALLKTHKLTQKQIKEELEADIAKFRAIYMKGQTPFTHEKHDFNPNKKLRIGYLSADFHCHAMMQFILPLLESHHNDNFEFILYSTTQKNDSVTQRIKNTGFAFKDCQNFSNKALAQTIFDDKIDILVDLSGYTCTRSFALFYKPAPIQMQYLGFINTMGMSEIDYIFADEYTIPEDMAKYYTEKPLYLGTSMQRYILSSTSFVPPAVSELPFHKNGYITFGSFNTVSKINDYTIELWAKLIKQVENAKLLIYRTQITDVIKERFRKKFAKFGIGEDRLIISNEKIEGSHFNAYSMADIALDPTPFNGLTITLETITMGVPVLTLPGKGLHAKGCARVNKAMELYELIATDENDYINKAKELASDIPRLENYRKTLRNRLENSLLVKDHNGFAIAVENAYRKAWYEYCGKHS